jgi:hypothetical protein
MGELEKLIEYFEEEQKGNYREMFFKAIFYLKELQQIKQQKAEQVQDGEIERMIETIYNCLNEDCDLCKLNEQCSGQGKSIEYLDRIKSLLYAQRIDPSKPQPIENVIRWLMDNPDWGLKNDKGITAKFKGNQLVWDDGSHVGIYKDRLYTLISTEKSEWHQISFDLAKCFFDDGYNIKCIAKINEQQLITNYKNESSNSFLPYSETIQYFVKEEDWSEHNNEKYEI